MREKYDKNSKNRSKTIDKLAFTSYNIYIIKQNKCLIKYERKEACHMGRKKRNKSNKKELLEQKKIRFQIYESVATIVATIVTIVLAIVTAVLNWIGN